MFNFHVFFESYRRGFLKSMVNKMTLLIFKMDYTVFQYDRWCPFFYLIIVLGPEMGSSPPISQKRPSYHF